MTNIPPIDLGKTAALNLERRIARNSGMADAYPRQGGQDGHDFPDAWKYADDGPLGRTFAATGVTA